MNRLPNGTVVIGGSLVFLNDVVTKHRLSEDIIGKVNKENGIDYVVYNADEGFDISSTDVKIKDLKTFNHMWVHSVYPDCVKIDKSLVPFSYELKDSSLLYNKSKLYHLCSMDSIILIEAFFIKEHRIHVKDEETAMELKLWGYI